MDVNYQDSITAPVDQSFSDAAIGPEGDTEEDEDDESSHMLFGVLLEIEKVCILLDVIYNSVVGTLSKDFSA
jgi:hypothetical protein